MTHMQPTLFDGPTYNEPRDKTRLKRQLDSVRSCLLSGGWWTLAQLSGKAHGSTQSVSARVRDLKKLKFGAYTIDKRHVGDGVWEYRMKI